MIEVKLISESSSSCFSWDLLLPLMPHLLWAAFLLALFLWLGPGTFRELLRKIAKLEVAGITLEFRQALEEAAAYRGQSPSAPELGRTARRLAASTHLVDDAQILWVDDMPGSVHREAQLLRSSGAVITHAASTQEALELARIHAYDLIFSDVRRGDDLQAGFGMAELLARTNSSTPLIFYVTDLKAGKPDHCFGITNRPDELLNLALDALSRTKG